MSDVDPDDTLHLEHLVVDDPPDEPIPDAPPLAASASRTPHLDAGAREAALRAELVGVQQVNAVIESVNASLASAQQNMETVSSTVASANSLLDLWIRILSQAEHTQRLLLNGRWEGASQDLADIDAEAAQKAADAERRREEARSRAEAREREAAAAEARRAAADSAPAGGKKAPRGGLKRGTTPAPRASGSRIGAGRGAPTRASARGGSGIGSGIGRALGVARGRGRATGT